MSDAEYIFVFCKTMINPFLSVEPLHEFGTYLFYFYLSFVPQLMVVTSKEQSGFDFSWNVVNYIFCGSETNLTAGDTFSLS